MASGFVSGTLAGMTGAERDVIRGLVRELSAFALRREREPHLLNPEVARRARARVAELELLLEEDDGEPMAPRELAETIAESRALMEDEPGPPVDGRIPPEDSGPVRLRAPSNTEDSGVHAALARRAKAALDDD